MERFEFPKSSKKQCRPKRAEREKDARVMLAEVESDIAAMLHDASDIYRDDEISFKLRQMHLLNEGIKESKGAVVVSSAYTEGFTDESAEALGKIAGNSFDKRGTEDRYRRSGTEDRFLYTASSSP